MHCACGGVSPNEHHKSDPHAPPRRPQRTLKLVKMPCAVSGRRNAVDDASASAPTMVWNMRLNDRGGVSDPGSPVAGDGIKASSASEAWVMSYMQGGVFMVGAMRAAISGGPLPTSSKPNKIGEHAQPYLDLKGRLEGLPLLACLLNQLGRLLLRVRVQVPRVEHRDVAHHLAVVQQLHLCGTSSEVSGA